MSTKKRLASIAPQPSSNVQDFIKGKTNAAEDTVARAPAPATAVVPVPVPAAAPQVASERSEVPAPTSTRPVGRPRATTTKEQRTIHLPSDLVKQAEHYRVEHRSTLSALIEMALRDYLERNQ